MASPKTPRSKLKRTAKFYRDNPKAYAKAIAKNSKRNKSPAMLKKRRELARENYARDKKAGGSAHRKGKDLSHTKRGLVYKSRYANRSSKSDSPGDKRARGTGRKRKAKKK